MTAPHIVSLSLGLETSGDFCGRVLHLDAVGSEWPYSLPSGSRGWGAKVRLESRLSDPVAWAPLNRPRWALQKVCRQSAMRPLTPRLPHPECAPHSGWSTLNGDTDSQKGLRFTEPGPLPLPPATGCLHVSASLHLARRAGVRTENPLLGPSLNYFESQPLP